MAALTTSLASVCASCLFGALSSNYLSYTQHVIQTITVSVTPYITVFPDGHNITSLHSRTITEAIVTGTGTSALTYTDPAAITWTVDGATLTYPTTYAHYYEFAGAAATSDGTPACAQQTDTSYITLPTNINVASFIYPLPANSTRMPLPTALLDYLDSFAAVTSQLHGEPLTACAPLPAAPATLKVRAAAPTADVQQQELRQFEGPRKSSTQHPMVTSALMSSSMPLVGRELYNATMFVYNGTNVTTSAANGNQTISTQYGGEPSNTSIPPPPSYASSEVQQTHSTAFVISAVTGRAIVTTESGSSPPAAAITSPADQAPPTTPIAQPQSTIPGSYGGGNGGQSPGSGSNPQGSNGQGGQQSAGGNGPSAAADSLPSSTPGSGSGSGLDIGNLVSGIQSVANGGSSPTSVDSGGSVQQVSGLLAGIGSVASSPTKGPGSVEDSQGAGSPGAKPVFNVGTTVISAGSNGEYSYGTRALTPGSTITAGNGFAAKALVMQTSAGSTELVYGGTTIPGSAPNSQVTPAPSVLPGAVITAGGKTFTAFQSSGSVIFEDGTSTLTLSAGAAGVFEGQQVSAASGRSGVVVGASSSVAFSALAPTGESGASEIVFTTNGHTVTAVESAGSIVLNDGSSTVTVPAGSVATFEGQTVSAPSTGGIIVINGQTVSASATTAAQDAIITANGHTFTAIETDGSVVLEDASVTMTIKDGSTAMFEGQSVSVASSGGFVVVDGTSTVSLTSAAPSTSNGLGSYIQSGINPGGSSTTSAQGATNTSGGDKVLPSGFNVFALGCVFAGLVMI